MNIGEFLSSINRFDLLVVLFCFGMFVLGFIQGTIRRVLGLASMLFSFLFAANLRDPLGSYLAAELERSSRTSTRSCSASGSCSSPRRSRSRS